ncbi:hypothetical protein [Sphaerotilus sp.]|uniref:hypothetical protein n=1 Tax=Sphaerotilus sp. TaxID=2093942 RepID=UPI00286DF192|nr:hypothetical protein [Sphaerotilus sp.]
MQPADHFATAEAESTAASPSVRLWLRVFGAVVAGVAALLLWTLLTPPFRGDLTRLGRLSETEFGPTQPPRSIERALRVSSALQDADVLVIGDSFSAPLLWQSALVAHGLKVATIDWQVIGPVCADLGSLLRAQGFRGSAVVIESVERGLAGHLDASLACAQQRTGRLQTRQTARDWDTTGPLGLNTSETLFTGLLTTLHTRHARLSGAEELVHHTDGADRVRIQRVPDGCQRFSHRLCERGLFFADDRTSAPFGPSSVEQMQQLARRQADLSITWLVLPNKSSIYLQADRAATVGGTLETAGLGPDLFGDFVRLSRQTRDLYSPNDTHTSTEGYRTVGQHVHEWLSAKTRR